MMLPAFTKHEIESIFCPNVLRSSWSPPRFCSLQRPAVGQPFPYDFFLQ